MESGIWQPNSSNSFNFLIFNPYHPKGQGKVYFKTWPVQNVTGELLLLSLSEVSQHLFEANINGAKDFYELKMKVQM